MNGDFILKPHTALGFLLLLALSLAGWAMLYVSAHPH
jgi:hypothetical protein